MANGISLAAMAEPPRHSGATSLGEGEIPSLRSGFTMEQAGVLLYISRAERRIKRASDEERTPTLGGKNRGLNAERESRTLRPNQCGVNGPKGLALGALFHDRQNSSVAGIGLSIVERSTIHLASWLGSRGRLPLPMVILASL